MNNDLQLDLTLGFYDAIFGCDKEIQISPVLTMTLHWEQVHLLESSHV
jgi:hypothetical protein